MNFLLLSIDFNIKVDSLDSLTAVSALKAFSRLDFKNHLSTIIKSNSFFLLFVNFWWKFCRGKFPSPWIINYEKSNPSNLIKPLKPSSTEPREMGKKWERKSKLYLFYCWIFFYVQNGWFSSAHFATTFGFLQSVKQQIKKVERKIKAVERDYK